MCRSAEDLSLAGGPMVNHDDAHLKSPFQPAISLKTKADWPFRGFLRRETEKTILFSKNEARKLLKTQDRCGKNRQNEPETKLAKLLKIHSTL